MNVPEQHQMKIALSTLKMNSTMASIMGGMNLKEAYKFLRDHGRTDASVQSYMRKHGHSQEDINNLLSEV